MYNFIIENQNNDIGIISIYKDLTEDVLKLLREFNNIEPLPKIKIFVLNYSDWWFQKRCFYEDALKKELSMKNQIKNLTLPTYKNVYYMTAAPNYNILQEFLNTNIDKERYIYFNFNYDYDFKHIFNNNPIREILVSGHIGSYVDREKMINYDGKIN